MPVMYSQSNQIVLTKRQNSQFSFEYRLFDLSFDYSIVGSVCKTDGSFPSEVIEIGVL